MYHYLDLDSSSFDGTVINKISYLKTTTIANVFPLNHAVKATENAEYFIFLVEHVKCYSGMGGGVRITCSCLQDCKIDQNFKQSSTHAFCCSYTSTHIQKTIIR